MTQEIILTNFGNLKAYPFSMTKTTSSFEGRIFFGEIEKFTNTEIHCEKVDAVNLKNSKTLKKENLSRENIFAIYNENNVGLSISHIHINNYLKNKLKELKAVLGKDKKLNHKEITKLEEEWEKELKEEFFNLVIKEVHKEI